jgi:hypothetical protein
MGTLPSAHIVAILILDGKIYKLEEFKIQFAQPVDYKQQPRHEIMGGQIMLTLSQTADHNLYSWATASKMLKRGSVLFQTDIGMTVLEINFSDAYCIQLLRETVTNAGTKTNLVISSDTIRMDEIEHTNKWQI